MSNACRSNFDWKARERQLLKKLGWDSLEQMLQELEKYERIFEERGSDPQKLKEIQTYKRLLKALIEEDKAQEESKTPAR